MRFRLTLYASARAPFDMMMFHSGKATMLFRQEFQGFATAAFQLRVARYRVPFSLTIRGSEPGYADVPFSLPIKTLMDIKVVSNKGEVFSGTSFESLPFGETKGIVILRENVGTGEEVTIETADGLVLFRGEAVRSGYNAEEDTWTVTVSDPLTAQGLEKEFELEAKPDIIEATPLPLVDLTEPTAFPTVPVNQGVTLRYWVALLESLKKGRIFYDADNQEYSLSSNPRRWRLNDSISFSEDFDAKRYYNMVVAEQDDSWEEAATRETKTTTYREYTLVVDRTGDQVHKVTLTKDGTVFVDESMTFDDKHNVINQISRKRELKTVTDYDLWTGGGDSFVQRERSTTTEDGSETPFSERRTKLVNAITNEDGTLLVVIEEEREWFEKEQVIEYE
ncbi:MAG: hypothetical protein BWY06_02482 [Candidatus Latescibacteria bacterium ADurb.Bin168]|nr:MAG: hypothetical protein BWY06_02482 [Candidatus Latescibacteria bacterium ADurb.Bin168]